MEKMYVLRFGETEWLYEGCTAFCLARAAGKLMLNRLRLQTATIRPYGENGETITIERKAA